MLAHLTSWIARHYIFLVYAQHEHDSFISCLCQASFTIHCRFRVVTVPDNEAFRHEVINGSYITYDLIV